MSQLIISIHARKRMFERSITEDDIMDVLAKGDTIETYENDYPFPSRLIVGWIRTNPIHLVVGEDPITKDQYIITAYFPHPSRWSDDFRSRK